jgi:hypothetical protein
MNDCSERRRYDVQIDDWVATKKHKVMYKNENYAG